MFTGKFAYGTRADCEREVSDRGSLCELTVTRRTSFLVIGTFGSEDWAHSSYGRKISEQSTCGRLASRCELSARTIGRVRSRVLPNGTHGRASRWPTIRPPGCSRVMNEHPRYGVPSPIFLVSPSGRHRPAARTNVSSRPDDEHGPASTTSSVSTPSVTAIFRRSNTWPPF